MTTTSEPFSGVLNQPTISMELILETERDDIGFLSIERYPQLKQLNIIGFPGVSFAEHSVRSPVVEDLVLTDCENLVDLSGIEEFTSLKRLWVSNCPLIDFSSNNIIDVRIIATGDGFEIFSTPGTRLFSHQDLDEVEEEHFSTFDAQQEEQGQGQEEEEEKSAE
jgi:hypothetical protein